MCLSTRARARVSTRHRLAGPHLEQVELCFSHHVVRSHCFTLQVSSWHCLIVFGGIGQLGDAFAAAQTPCNESNFGCCLIACYVGILYGGMGCI